MKRYLLFVGLFSLAFFSLQIFSGMLLTVFYTPSMSWENAAALPAQVEFGHVSFISPFLISILALGIAYGVTRLVSKRTI